MNRKELLQLHMSAKAAHDEHTDEHHARIFTKEEMDDMWAHMIHVNSGDDDGTYSWQPWMAPLATIYRQVYNSHSMSDVEAHNAKQAQVQQEIEAAYRAGLAGDLESVDRFVGGYELSSLDVGHIPYLKIEYINIELKVLAHAFTGLDSAGAGGNMDATTPNEVNNGKLSTDDCAAGSSRTAVHQQ